MTKILIADGMDKAALEQLKATPGFEVTVAKGLSETELVQTVPGYSAIVVRSASRITRPVIEAGKDLQVLVRAGIGLDNIDSAAAKEKGILVANTPAATVLKSDDGRVIGIHRNTAERGGKRLDVGCCIVFEFKNGRVIDGREHFYDLYAWDEFWR